MDDFNIEVDQEYLAKYARLSTQVKKDVIEQLGLEIDPDSDIIYFNSKKTENVENIKNSLYGLWLDFKYHLPDIYIFLFYVLFTLYNIYYISKFVEAFITMDLARMEAHPIEIFATTLSPYFVWMYQSNREFWNFYNIKKATLLYIVSMMVVKVNALIFNLVYILLIPRLADLSLSDDITINLILEFAYFMHGLFLLIGTVVLIRLFNKMYVKGQLGPKIEEFKLRHHTGFLYSSKLKYDLIIAKDMKTGKDILIKEKDRGLHSEALGASGTGKTSMVILRMVERDLEKRRYISNILKKKFYKMLTKGQLYINEEFEDGKFAPSYFTPNKGYEKKYEKLKRRYRLIGITVVAPDTSTTDAVIKLAHNRGISANVCDPVPDPETGKLKNGFIGVNGLVVKEGLKGWQYDTALCKNATVLADLMQKRFESSGKTDIYFSSVNRIATTTLSILLMLTYKALNNRKTPTVNDIAYLLNDFSRIEPYLKELKTLNVDGKYQTYVDILENEFKSERFWEHSTGLRIQFNTLLENSLLKNILCHQNSIDFDRILENSEITVCNTSLAKLGEINSATLGLIFTNSMVEATLNRPDESTGKYIAPHVLAIDEFAKIVTPLFESCFTLFRKYWVFMLIALQTFDQMKKEEFLKYLRGIILNSCAHHFIFGRANFSDMQEFSQLAGEKDVTFVEVRETTNSLLDKNPSFSESKTEKTQKEALLSPGDVRNRDFQEITLFTVRDGSPINGVAIHAKVRFLKPSEKIKKRFIHKDWPELMKTQAIVDTPIDKTEKTSTADTELLNETLPEELSLQKVGETTIKNIEKSEDTGNIVLRQKTFRKSDPVLSTEAEESINKTLLSTTNVIKSNVEGSESSCSQESITPDLSLENVSSEDEKNKGTDENTEPKYIILDDHSAITEDLSSFKHDKKASDTAVPSKEVKQPPTSTLKERNEGEGEEDGFFKIVIDDDKKSKKVQAAPKKEQEQNKASLSEPSEKEIEKIDDEDIVYTLDDIIK